jgi:hypothetical protein
MIKYLTPLLLSLILLVASEARADSPEIWKTNSPSGTFFAAVRRIPDKDFIWKEEVDGFRLVIFRVIPDTFLHLGEKLFAYEGEGRIPAQIKWSKDSNYLIFTTTSTGGHSPWHFSTYAVDMNQKKLVSVDEKIGSVVSADFKLTGAHSAVFQIAPEGGDFEHPKECEVDLSKLF